MNDHNIENEIINNNHTININTRLLNNSNELYSDNSSINSDISSTDSGNTEGGFRRHIENSQILDLVDENHNIIVNFKIANNLMSMFMIILTLANAIAWYNTNYTLIQIWSYILFAEELLTRNALYNNSPIMTFHNYISCLVNFGGAYTYILKYDEINNTDEFTFGLFTIIIVLKIINLIIKLFISIVTSLIVTIEFSHVNTINQDDNNSTIAQTQIDNSLDEFSLTEETLNAMKNDSDTSSNDLCSICLSKFRVNNILRQLPCDGNHIFHKNCIDNWLETNQTCPHCRQVINIR